MARTAILIGQDQLCRRLEHQLQALAEPPRTIGWLVAGVRDADLIGKIASPASRVLGTLDDLEAVCERYRPNLALICLPAAMADLIVSLRTRLRRLGVPDRFLPTLEDQIEGVGPRSQLDIDPAKLIDRPARTIDEDAVRDVIKDRVVLVTGAGGSIGGELSRICARFAPRRLLLMDRSENALFEIDRQVARARPELDRRALLHDVVDMRGTLRLFEQERPDVIFHAAAHKHVPMMEDHPGAAIDNNFFGTKSVADAAHATAADRFVMISTDKAVNPSSIMGATKRLAELYVQSINQRSETAFSMVRFGNVLGSSGSVLGIWASQIAEGGPVTITDERMTRYFMTIPEAASLVIQAASLVDESAQHGEVFLLDMGEPLNILDLARRFIAAHGLHPRMARTDQSGSNAGEIEIVTIGARPGEKLYESLSFDMEALRPTRHPDINIWMIPPPDRRYIDRVVEVLAPGKRSQDRLALAHLIRELVPEMTRPAIDRKTQARKEFVSNRQK